MCPQSEHMSRHSISVRIHQPRGLPIKPSDLCVQLHSHSLTAATTTVFKPLFLAVFSSGCALSCVTAACPAFDACPGGGAEANRIRKLVPVAVPPAPAHPGYLKGTFHQHAAQVQRDRPPQHAHPKWMNSACVLPCQESDTLISCCGGGSRGTPVTSRRPGSILVGQVACTSRTTVGRMRTLCLMRSQLRIWWAVLLGLGLGLGLGHGLLCRSVCLLRRW